MSKPLVQSIVNAVKIVLPIECISHISTILKMLSDTLLLWRIVYLNNNLSQAYFYK